MRVKDLPGISKLSTPEKILKSRIFGTVSLLMNLPLLYRKATSRNWTNVSNGIHLLPVPSLSLDDFQTILKQSSL